MRQGTFSVFRLSTKEAGRREPGMQLTMVAAEGVEAALAANAIDPLDSVGELRRNVVTRGLAPAALHAAVGCEIALGDQVLLFAHRLCVPCLYNECKLNRPGLTNACWDVGGLCCEVVRGGTLKPGDAVRIASAPDPSRVDAGSHPPDFFIRPRLRTRAMVARSQQIVAALIPRLLEVCAHWPYTLTPLSPLTPHASPAAL